MYFAQFKDYATNVKNIRPTENGGGWTKPKWKYWEKVHRQKRPKHVGKPQTHSRKFIKKNTRLTSI